MNTKQIGDLTQLVIMTKLHKNGYAVLIPFGDNEHYDLVTEINGELKKCSAKLHAGSEKIALHSM